MGEILVLSPKSSDGFSEVKLLEKYVDRYSKPVD